jgi:hypothetical protein
VVQCTSPSRRLLLVWRARSWLLRGRQEAGFPGLIGQWHVSLAAQNYDQQKDVCQRRNKKKKELGIENNKNGGVLSNARTCFL